LRCRWEPSTPTGEQFVDPVDGVVGDAREDIGQPGLRIDVVEPGGLCRTTNYAERAHIRQPLS
jgi:hypothetical protein